MKMGRIDVYRKMVVGSVNARSSTAQLIFSGSRRGGRAHREERAGLSCCGAELWLKRCVRFSLFAPLRGKSENRALHRTRGSRFGL